MDPSEFCEAIRAMNVEKVKTGLETNRKVLWGYIPMGCQYRMQVITYLGYVLDHLPDETVQDVRLKTIARLVTESLYIKNAADESVNASPDMKAFALLRYAVAAGWKDIIRETVPLSSEIPNPEVCRNDEARKFLADRVKEKNSKQE